MRKEKKDELENKKTVFQARYARNTVTIANNERDSVNMTKIGHKKNIFRLITSQVNINYGLLRDTQKEREIEERRIAKKKRISSQQLQKNAQFHRNGQQQSLSSNVLKTSEMKRKRKMSKGRRMRV